MQVLELADDLGVTPEVLLSLLRTLRISASDKEAVVSEADVAIVLSRVERERRGGHKDSSAAVEAAIEDVQSHTGRRRRRKKVDMPPPPPDEPDGVEEDADDLEEVDESTEDAAELVSEADDPEATGELVTEEEAEPEPEPEPEVEAVEASSDTADEVVEPSVAEVDPPEPMAQEPAIPAEVFEKPEPARFGGEDGPARVLAKPAPAASAGPGGKVRIQAEGYTSDGRRKERGPKKGKKRQRVDQGAVQENIQRVMAQIKGGGKKRKRRSSGPSKEELEAIQEVEREEEERERTTVRVNEFLTVSELSDLVDVSSTEIIGAAFKDLGIGVTINQRLDFVQIEMLLDGFGFTAVLEEEYAAADVHEEEVEDPATLQPRPPVVTVMGHVDHGKTRLLDFIRSANVVAGEAGGITQHIGAYHVDRGDRSITFLDTPGHAAFTAMRARGTDVTDIVALVVAADDAVMPQTKEAISHARNGGVPLVVAINKCDLPSADPNRVKQALLQEGVNVEDFGGDVLVAEISAKEGTGVDDLLEKILLQAELLELKANPDRPAVGAVIEAELDPGKGPVATVLVQKGTLRVGDSYIIGQFDGRVRAMLDERGQPVKEAGPGIPVQILGAGGVPQAGDALMAMTAEKAAEISQSRQRLEREKQLRIKERGVKLGDFANMAAEGKTDTLPLIIKADVDGSVQALADALEQLGTDEVRVQILHRAVGAINEEDVLLAQSAAGVIIGFRVRPHTKARLQAERDDVDIHVYDVIYEAVDEVKAALEGMLTPERKETVVGSAEVREIFRVSKVGTIAGSYVQDGLIDRRANVRLIREGIVVYDGEISSLKRFKDDVKEVREGFECGIGIGNFNDIKVDDVIECYRVTEIARTLASAGQPGG
ncbi:MAG: translation initiation factor IF-2 [Gemmatimonadota bacterium]|nr:MAG: translation initiation factor IF-2 [Gemmatimonadota bacterium]